MKILLTLLLLASTSCYAAGGLLLGTPQATSQLIINATFDGGEPAFFTTAVADAITYVKSHVLSPITVNISFHYSTLAGSTLAATDLTSGGVTKTYAQVRTAYLAAAVTADQITAANSLPASDPTSGGTFIVVNAQARVLGFIAARGAGLDGDTTVNNTVNWTLPAGRDLTAVLEHEITHTLGRVAILGLIASSYGPEDMFRYSALNTRVLTAGPASYFSIDNGATALRSYSTSPTYSDWSTAVSDQWNVTLPTGTLPGFSVPDFTRLNVLGYTVAP